MFQGTNFTHNPKEKRSSTPLWEVGTTNSGRFNIFCTFSVTAVVHLWMKENLVKVILNCIVAIDKNKLHRIYSIRKFNKSKLHSTHTYAYLAQSMSSLFLLLLFLVLHMDGWYVFICVQSQPRNYAPHTHIYTMTY